MPEWWRHQHEGDRLSAFLDDELAEDQALEVARHVARCEKCQDELEAIRAARHALRGLPNLRPPDLLFEQAVASAGALDRRSRALRIGVAAVAGTAIVGMAAFMAGQDDAGTVVPPVDIYVVDHVVQFGGGPVLTPVDLDR